MASGSNSTFQADVKLDEDLTALEKRMDMFRKRSKDLSTKANETLLQMAERFDPGIPITLNDVASARSSCDTVLQKTAMSEEN